MATYVLTTPTLSGAPGEAEWSDAATFAAGLSGTTTLASASIGNSTVLINIAVPGAQEGDVVSLGLTKELVNNALIYYGYISGANQLTIAIRDLSGAPQVIAGDCGYLITRPA
jgi:hypothetical protein